jgi:hypothetical protein
MGEVGWCLVYWDDEQASYEMSECGLRTFYVYVTCSRHCVSVSEGKEEIDVSGLRPNDCVE